MYIQLKEGDGMEHRKVLVRLPVELIEAIDKYVGSQVEGTATRNSIVAQTLADAFPLAMGEGYRYEGQYRSVGWRGKSRAKGKTTKLEDAE